MFPMGLHFREECFSGLSSSDNFRARLSGAVVPDSIAFRDCGIVVWLCETMCKETGDRMSKETGNRDQGIGSIIGNWYQVRGRALAATILSFVVILF